MLRFRLCVPGVSLSAGASSPACVYSCRMHLRPLLPLMQNKRYEAKVGGHDALQIVSVLSLSLTRFEGHVGVFFKKRLMFSFNCQVIGCFFFK